MSNCIFCDKENFNVYQETQDFIAVMDKYPVTEGHLLVLPKLHRIDFFSLSSNEREEAFIFIDKLKIMLEESDDSITGFNIGMNCGEVESKKHVEGCPFCEAISDKVSNKSPSHIDKTVLAQSENGNFFIIPQRGGFLPGSVLIASNNHNQTRISDMSKVSASSFLTGGVKNERRTKLNPCNIPKPHRAP